MSGDIGPGDKVLCLPLEASTCRYRHECDDDPHYKSPLVSGRYYTVLGCEPPSGDDCAALHLAEQDSGGVGFCAGRFRKLNDGEDNVELIARIKSCSPNRVPVTAATSPNAAEGRDSPLVPALTYLNGDEE